MLIAFCSDKGSPGVTTAALAVATASPQPCIVVEADLAGGDLGIRVRTDAGTLPEAPTVLSLAAAARTDRDADLVARHAQRLNQRISVIPAALRAEQMAKVADWTPAAEALARSEPPVLADLGQLHSASPVLPIAAAADVVIVVGRPDMTSVVRLRDRLAQLGPQLGALRGVPPRLFALLISTPRLGPAHASDLAVLLSETAANPFLIGTGFLALDPVAAARLERGADPSGRLARTHLLRTARTVVSDLQAGNSDAVPSAAIGARGGAR